jgi:hypothetical protein
MLLTDIRTIFQARKLDRICSDNIVSDLCQFEGTHGRITGAAIQ